MWSQKTTVRRDRFLTLTLPFASLLLSSFLFPSLTPTLTMILDGTSPLAQISLPCLVVVAASSREAREVYASSRVLKLKDLRSQVFG